MLIMLESTHPKFSWLLAKNPQTQATTGKPFERAMRKGRLFGWFTAEAGQPLEHARRFTVWFKDSDTEASFAPAGQGNFEYLDQTRHSSPYAVLFALNEMLRSAAQGQYEESEANVENEHSVTIPSLYVPWSFAGKQFQRHFPDVNFELIPLVGKVCRLRARHRGTLKRLLSWLQLFCLLQLLGDFEMELTLDSGVVTRYAKLLAEMDAPYFMRYLFSRKALLAPERFKEAKPLLETEAIKLCFGDTKTQRFHAVSRELPGGVQLLDIGCGEGWQALRLARKYEAVAAFDTNEELIERNQRVARRKNLEHLTFEWGLNPEKVADLPLKPGCDVLMTEVIEHMPLTDAAALVGAVLSRPIRTLVLTTPDHAFNVHYDVERRHDDHHWEMCQTEFSEWVHGLVGDRSDLSVQVRGIGDSVDGVHTSLMAVIRREAA